MSTLHYIFDPLCGWCYAAAPLIDAARNQSALTIVLHGGGMLTGSNRRQITAQWRDYVIPHDRRIAKLTGQPFGERYFEDLLRDSTAVLDSEPPTTAILAAEEISGYGLDMLHRVQHAHYAEGRRIADHDVLSELRPRRRRVHRRTEAQHRCAEHGYCWRRIDDDGKLDHR